MTIIEGENEVVHNFLLLSLSAPFRVINDTKTTENPTKQENNNGVFGAREARVSFSRWPYIIPNLICLPQISRYFILHTTANHIQLIKRPSFSLPDSHTNTHEASQWQERNSGVEARMILKKVEEEEEEQLERNYCHSNYHVLQVDCYSCPNIIIRDYPHKKQVSTFNTTRR